MTQPGGAMTLPMHLPAGTAADAGYPVAITPETAGWAYASLRVLALPPGAEHTFDTGDEEFVVLPLGGACRVACAGEVFDLAGRADVFDRVTDFAYLPVGSRVTVSSEGGGRFALPAARATRRLPFRYVAAADVPVEIRGAGTSSRQVNNFCAADTFDADRLIAVEVLTPGGNWSSYPPHKHDTERPGESALEEIYYFEVAAHEGTPGLAYQRVYGTAERPADLLVEVRAGDVVTIPFGWHGPSMTAPGYDLYYLNVMAGGGERVWNVCDDPDHSWVRSSWADQPVDPRLPLTTARSRS